MRRSPGMAGSWVCLLGLIWVIAGVIKTRRPDLAVVLWQLMVVERSGLLDGVGGALREQADCLGDL